mgnify:CR=1 FL=1
MPVLAWIQGIPSFYWFPIVVFTCALLPYAIKGFVFLRSPVAVKKDIELYDVNATQIIRDTEIITYNYDLDDEKLSEYKNVSSLYYALLRGIELSFYSSISLDLLVLRLLLTITNFWK